MICKVQPLGVSDPTMNMESPKGSSFREINGMEREINEEDEKIIDTLDNPVTMIKNFRLIYNIIIKRVPFYFYL